MIDFGTTCVRCNQEGATGSWELCPECRERLAERHREQLRTAQPALCFGCGEVPPKKNGYCQWCARRFKPKA